jgi:hypothetical protein
MRDPLGTLIALLALWLLVAAIVLWLTRSDAKAAERTRDSQDAHT